jgi:hypothetical protein
MDPCARSEILPKWTLHCKGNNYKHLINAIKILTTVTKLLPSEAKNIKITLAIDILVGLSSTRCGVISPPSHARNSETRYLKKHAYAITTGTAK